MAKQGFKLKYYVNYILVGLLFAVMLVLDFSGAMKRSTANMMAEIGIYIILAVSLNLVVGFLGELSLGHAGFMCIGAYLGGYVAKMVQNANLPEMLSLAVALCVGALAASVVGFLIGLPTLRLKGDYLAIVTLAFGEIIRTLFKNMPASVFGGAQGLDTITWTPAKGGVSRFYIVAFLFVFVTVFFSQNLQRSKHGRAIQAIRDNEIAARACGVNVTYYKLVVFVSSAFFAGIAGVLYAFYATPVDYSYFSFNKSIEILVMVVLGGMGNLTGSIIAAVALTFVNVKLTTLLSGDMAAFKYLIYALILIVAVVWNNAPALRPVRERFGVQRLGEILRTKFHRNAGEAEVNASAVWDRIPTKIAMDAILSADLLPNDAYEPDKTEEKGGGKE